MPYGTRAAKLPPGDARTPARRAIVCASALLVACGARPLPPAAPAERAGAVVWDYDVRVPVAPVDSLEVEAAFAKGSADALTIDDVAAPFVRDVQVNDGVLWRPIARSDSGWVVPCRALGCRVRYRFALREAATRLDDGETALLSGDVIVAPPSTWLLHPVGDAPDAGKDHLRFHVDLAAGVRFTAGMHANAGAGEEPSTFEASTTDLESSSFAVFGDFHAAAVERPGARVSIAIAPRGLTVSDSEVAVWVGRAVDAIATYYGRFPVAQTLVVVVSGRPGSSTRGMTLGDGGPGVLVKSPGLSTPELVREAVRDDWVMTHELLHVTLPTLPHEHVWLSEGLPSYIEPLARARVGQLSLEKLWRDLVDGLPQGLPEAGDQGLDHTHTWGRTYWGGALFCLLADVTIRERTGGAKSLDDAVRAVVAAGGTVESHWEVGRFIDVGDRATGTTVLGDLYRSLALASGTVDLPALLARLGVQSVGTGIRFDDRAPLASIRRAMTAVQPVAR